MTRITDDPNDPGIERGGADSAPRPQSEAYLVLSEEERARGFVRPVRSAYKHVGVAGPVYPLRDITLEEIELHARSGWVKYEKYPPGFEGSALGRWWTQEKLDSVGGGCGVVTTMGRALSETYAAKPGFYGGTYCVGCEMHRPVGKDGEFVWDGTDERVGT